MIAICNRRAPNNSLLITQALVICFRRLATCSSAVFCFYLYGPELREFMNAVVMSFAPAVEEGWDGRHIGEQITGGSSSQCEELSVSLLLRKR